MVTLQTLYCSVILQSLTSLKIMITEDQQPKIWELSVYAYVDAPAPHMNRTHGMAAPLSTLGSPREAAGPPSQWFPTSQVCLQFLIATS